MSRGRFITLEGIDGAGKQQPHSLDRPLVRARGIKVKLTREPGGTPAGESLRRLVLASRHQTTSLRPRRSSCSRPAASTSPRSSGPRWSAAIWVLCDRFTDATYAYQGNGRGVDASLIEALATAVHPDVLPDCTLLLDLPATHGLNRARSRAGGSTDRFEAETVEFFERVRAGYLELARREPGRFHVIDAAAPLMEVEHRVAAALATLNPPARARK